MSQHHMREPAAESVGNEIDTASPADSQLSGLLNPSGEHQILRAMFEVSPDAIILTDPQRRLLMLNPAAEQMFGYRQDEAVGSSVRMIYLSDEQFTQTDRQWNRNSTESATMLTTTLSRRDGSTFTAEMSRQPLRDAPGRISGYLTIVRDVTDQLRDQRELHDTRDRLELINAIATAVRVGMSIEQILEITLAKLANRFGEYRIGYWSITEPGVLQMTQAHQPRNMPPITGQFLDLNTSPQLLAQFTAGRTVVTDNLELDDFGPTGRKSLALGTHASVAVPLLQEQRLTGVLTLACGQPHHWTDHERRTIEQVGHYLSICLIDAMRQQQQIQVEQALKRSEADLRRLAYHDPLTGLANRARLLEQLRVELDRQTDDDRQFAVLFIDFDRFKMINDTMGHELGDQLLVSIADRLNSELNNFAQLRGGQSHGLAARIGGDEFVILLHGRCGDPKQQVCPFVDQLQIALAQPHDLGGQMVVCTASIGIVVVQRGQYQRPEQVVRDADIAMYEAKSSGRSRCAWFDHLMRNRILERAALETDLRRALTERQFRLNFQPIFSLESGQVTGFETVIRWHDPKRGMVPPHRFLPIAQELGLGMAMGQWVVQEACAHWRSWQIPGSRHVEHPLTLHINLFSEQLIRNQSADMLARTLHDVDMPASALMLEIPKTIFVQADASPMQALQQIHRLGVGIAVDNFAFGSSSLVNLHQLPVRQVKLSSTLVRDMQNRIEYAALVQATITLAHSLGLMVVAEGIETDAQLSQLQALNCDMGQGFYFAPPLSSREAAQFVAGRTPLPRSA